MTEYIDLINKMLDDCLSGVDAPHNKIIEAMRYSTLNGGKRVRATLALEFYRQFHEDVIPALPLAAAIEMIHSYSLIHDDLPSMDNDDMRRGKPSCHVAFGETIAILAGDALNTLAFETLLRIDKTKVTAENIIFATSEFAKCAGTHGMVAGQVIDTTQTAKTLEALQQIHHLKTSKLIIAASKCACILANADRDFIDESEKFADNLGLAFQIIDDILDVTSSAEVLGKATFSDEDSEKTTYVSILGIEKARESAKIYSEKARESAKKFPNSERLLKIVDVLLVREF